ncbi:protein bunched, class 2/F/G isoform-like [Microplitis mediator]|uniref:protein bunched, class 2/F/G isoform-like n=1 Tax=Microplitis mediator TaxID=375433 RepID=UPI0025558D5D|nr:protein bunched, class 2/F/G isoform-like [Microplitis mediator]
MGDNVHRKSHKQSENINNKKQINAINRTTTETMRLGEPDRTHPALGLSVPSNITPSNQCKKKTSSFQITSVTVGSRMSNDAGEDSNDDLDESHGEDTSIELSRITDIETPSYSEDTFSKEDVFFNASNAALSTAPVIPTSSQYGLAIVPSEGGNVNNSTNDTNINTLDIASVTDNNIINLLSSTAKQDTDIREVHSHGRNERFKVVKIESTEPFKRGRWTCMDYLDHTNSVNQSNAIGTPKVSDPNEVCISYGVTDGGIIALDPSKSLTSEDNGIINVDMNGHATHQDIITSMISSTAAAASASSSSSTAATAAGYPVSNNSLPQSVQRNVPPVQTQPQVQQPTQIPQYFQSSPQQQQQQQQQLASQQHQHQPQGGQQQGSTLPANLQNTHPNNLGQPQSMPQGSIPIITQTNNNNVTPQQNISHTKEDNTYVTVSSQNQSMPGQNVCQSSVQSSASSSQASNILVAQHQPQQQQPQPQQQQQPPQQQQGLQAPTSMTQISEPMNTLQNMQGMQSIHNVPQSGGQQPTSTIHVPGGPLPNQVIAPTSMQQQQQQQQSQPTGGANTQVQMTQVSGNCQNVVSGIQQQQQQQQQQQGSMGFHQPDIELDSMSGGLSNAGSSQLADAALLECLAEVTQTYDDHHTLEDNESMPGTSAVAIDNKIEQAMDLVKSHLMFAVREEVEVLKEKIAELMDRINQLEAENSILRAHATPETLAQLSQSTTKLPQNNNPASGQ